MIPPKNTLIVVPGKPPLAMNASLIASSTAKSNTQPQKRKYDEVDPDQ